MFLVIPSNVRKWWDGPYNGIVAHLSRYYANVKFKSLVAKIKNTYDLLASSSLPTGVFFAAGRDAFKFIPSIMYKRLNRLIFLQMKSDFYKKGDGNITSFNTNIIDKKIKTTQLKREKINISDILCVSVCVVLTSRPHYNYFHTKLYH